MAVSGPAYVADTAKAFDAVAPEYHRSNVENPILQHMRRRTLSVLLRSVPGGSRILDLGCGPGTDHPDMVRAGYHVTGIDISPEMIHEAAQRASAMSGATRPTLFCAPIQRLQQLALEPFDAVFSNFGPLNCVPDLVDAARQIHHLMKPRGVLIASVIGRVCPWEIALYLARGDASRAFTRFRRGPVRVPLKDGTVWMQYATPGGFERTFASAGFTRRERYGLGVIAPPPYMNAFATRRPALVERLLDLDDVVGRWPFLRSVGDHFLVVLDRA